MNRDRRNKINKFVDVNVINNSEYVNTVANIIANNARFSDRYYLTYVDRTQLFFDVGSRDGNWFKCEVRVGNGMVVGMNDSSDKSYNGFDIKLFEVGKNTKVSDFADWLVDRMDEFLGLEHKECYLVEE